MDGIRFLRPLSAGALLLLTACATVRQTDPPQTATEQLLVSHAVERAVGQLNPRCPPTGTVFLDTQYYDTDNGSVLAKYTVGAVRDRLLRLGCRLTDDRKSAEVVLELRQGAQSIDQSSTLVGIPSIPIPIPLSGVVSTPEIAFFKIARLDGVSKLALTGIDRNGALVTSTGPTFGQSRHRDYVILLVSYSTHDIYADDQDPPSPVNRPPVPPPTLVAPPFPAPVTPATTPAPAAPGHLPGLSQ
jgi:hypothetical protein